LAYIVKGAAYLKLAQGINPQSVVLIKGGIKYDSRIINYVNKNYIKTDFRIETLFSDVVNTSFFAD